MPITKLSKKKDGLQGYRVRVNYTDRDGKYRQIERTAYGKTEALELERRLLSDAVNAPKDESSQLFSEFVASYLAYKSGEVRETSYRNSEKNLRLYILPTLGAIRLDRLSSSDVAAWKTRMNETDLSLRTKHTAFRELSAVLNYALTLKLIPENPANFNSHGRHLPRSIFLSRCGGAALLHAGAISPLYPRSRILLHPPVRALLLRLLRPGILYRDAQR